MKYFYYAMAAYAAEEEAIKLKVMSGSTEDPDPRGLGRKQIILPGGSRGWK